MELRKSEPLRVLNYQRIGVGNVNSRLNNSGADENVYLAREHLAPYILKLLLVHLSVSDRDSRLGYRLCELCGASVDALNEVVEVEHLSASSELAAYSLKKYQLVVFKNVGLHGQSVARCLVKHRYIAYSAHRHIQRSRDRSCGQRQNVNISRHLLELFLLSNAKALLLVNDEKPEILEFYILAYKSVSSDDNVSLATLELSQRVRLLLWRAEARDHIHVDRKGSHSAGQRLKML